MNDQKELSGPKHSKRILASEELLQGEREIMIKHADGYYRLMVTKAGKLILNK